MLRSHTSGLVWGALGIMRKTSANPQRGRAWEHDIAPLDFGRKWANGRGERPVKTAANTA